MRWILERLLILFTPLFAVAATGKKTAVKKRGAPRARGATKKPARPARSATTKKAKPSGARRPAARGKATATSKATKAPPGPPLPKPPAPIGRAILLVPENGKYAESVTPTLRWLSVGGANKYEVVWSEDPGFAGSHSVGSVATGASVPADRPLRVGATYYWRVRGGNEGGWGPWSLPASFQVLEESPTS